MQSQIIDKKEHNRIIKPTPEDFNLNHNQLILIEDEIEYLKLRNQDAIDKVEHFGDMIMGFPINLFSYMFIALILLSIPLYLISNFLNLEKLKEYGIYYIIIMGILLIQFALSSFVFLLIKSILESKDKQIENRKKYTKYNEFKNAMREYIYKTRLQEKTYWYSLSGRSFEIELANLFKSKNFRVSVSKQGGDGGIDLLVEKDNQTIGVQCKAHAAKIPPHVARDLLGTITSRSISKGMLATFNGGTAGTVEFCKSNNIALWTVDDILDFEDDNTHKANELMA